MRRILLMALCSMSMGLFAANPTFDGTESQAYSASNSISEAASNSAGGRNVDSPGDDLSTNGDSVLTADSKKGGSAYTFSDFFDALDLPTVLGAGVTPNGIESATFNSSMRLAWRHHKGYGTYVFIAFDTHSNTYDSLAVHGTNVRTGEVWYYEIGMGLGYRIPLVKDLRAYYEQPYFNRFDFFAYIQPGVSIPYVKTVVPYHDTEGESDLYALRDQFSAVPTLRFGAGVEWFIMPNFGVFAEAAYIQHLTPTIIEQAAIDKGVIRHPSGPLVFSIGLSLFFK